MENEQAQDQTKAKGKTNFESETQQNLIRIVEYLSSDVLRPVTIKEIQGAFDLSYNKALWTLQNLKLAGWVEQTADSWRLGPRLPKIAQDVRKSIADTVKGYLGE